MDTGCVVVGAGPAGVAVARHLTSRGRSTVVLESDRVASRWRSGYESLHLNTHRRASSLPDARMARPSGSHPSAVDYARYLEGLAAGLDIRTVTARRIEREGGRLVVRTDAESFTADHVVVATGAARRPRWPDWPDRTTFPGVLLHADEFGSGFAYRGRDVLVIGGGNSAADIVADLDRAGARSIALSVRRGPQLVPRMVGPVPVQSLGIAMSRLPAVWGDTVMKAVRRLWFGDLERYGLPSPVEPLSVDHATTGTIPIVDRGFVRVLRRGGVTVVPGTADVGPRGVLLDDGSVCRPDVVIAATGYSSGLQDLVGHLGVLDERGLPAGPDHPRDLDGLWFLGYNDPLSGQLRQIGADARLLVDRLVSTGGVR